MSPQLMSPVFRLFRPRPLPFIPVRALAPLPAKTAASVVPMLRRK